MRLQYAGRLARLSGVYRHMGVALGLERGRSVSAHDRVPAARTIATWPCLRHGDGHGLIAVAPAALYHQRRRRSTRWRPELTLDYERSWLWKSAYGRRIEERAGSAPAHYGRSGPSAARRAPRARSPRNDQVREGSSATKVLRHDQQEASGWRAQLMRLTQRVGEADTINEPHPIAATKLGNVSSMTEVDAR